MSSFSVKKVHFLTSHQDMFLCQQAFLLSFLFIFVLLQYTQRRTYKMYSLTSNSMATTFLLNPFIQGIPEHEFIVITR